ncbi:TetR/AcrR family transcriptional regulator [Myceligenerans pegani]|uniref:TetR/AcrR family transcriptional regulator n=1 Tax=Myceligenerans pegani TaxID=2776917 RepID=A0ABR9MVY6_9MICO|nr:TetR/AcrR family transcriptional regulator [Myceligenerans sp. TRM 65318]MBE1875552.1 TetR/AcrR family transcriptional regulator [Myceligenerans sp. TRM 65318]MBE3017823.1 TetR/AcrR family transcriptional regulator [Myceligenerans sp. TRM 65318]
MAEGAPETAPETEAGTVDPRIVRTRRDVVDATTALLRAEGWGGVTHAEVARRAGYSKATVYAHWPTRLDLIEASVGQICSTSQHPEPTGDLRADLIAELTGLAEALTEGQLARIFGGILERAGSDPGVDEVRRQLVAEGSGPMAAILAAHLPPDAVDAALALLNGGVLFRIGFQALPADRAFITDLVDRVLATTAHDATP